MFLKSRALLWSTLVVGLDSYCRLRSDTIQSQKKLLAWLVLLSVVVCNFDGLELKAQTERFFGDLPATENADLATLKRLWNLELFSAAKAHCEFQISQLEPGTDLHANWYRWRIATMFNGMLMDPVVQSRPLTEATDIGRQLVSEYQSLENHQRRVYWIEKETLQGRLLVATFVMANSLANPADKALREDSLLLVRSILADAENLVNEINAFLPNWANKPRGSKTSPPINDAQILKLELALLRCDSLLLRSEAYQDNSNEQLATAATMDEILENARRLLDKSWSGYVRFELAAAKTLVLQQRYKESVQLCRSLAGRREIPDAIRSSVAATMVKATRLSRELNTAQRILDVLPDNLKSPETEIEQLLLVLSPLVETQPTLSETKRDELLSQALALRDSIEKTYGPYWRSRAESALITYSNGSVNSVDSESENSARLEPSKRNTVATDVQQIRARQLIAAGRIDEALTELKKAEAICAKNNLLNEALQFATQRAALLANNSRRGEAIDCIIDSSNQFESSEQASKTHLTGAYLIANEIRELSKGDSNERVVAALRDKYRSTLINQISRWPGQPEVNQAILWLEKSFDAAGENQSATEAWITAGASTGRSEFSHIGMWRAIITHSVDMQSNQSAFQNWFDGTLDRIKPKPNRLQALSILKSSFEFLPDSDVRLVSSELIKTQDRIISATNQILVTLRTGGSSNAMESKIEAFNLASQSIESSTLNPINNRLVDAAKVLIATKIGEANFGNFAMSGDSAFLKQRGMSADFLNQLRVAVETTTQLSEFQKLLIMSRMAPFLPQAQRSELFSRLKEKITANERIAILRFAYVYGLFYDGDFESAKQQSETLLAGAKPNSEVWLRAKVIQFLAKRNIKGNATDDNSNQNARSDIEYVLAAYELSSIWNSRLNSLLELGL